MLQELVNRPAAVQQAYGLDEVCDQDVVNAYIQVCDWEQGDWEYTEVTGEENRARLCQAIRTDLEEGGLGERFLLNDRTRAERTYCNDIELEYLVQDPKTGRSYTESKRITLQTGAVHTLRVLEEMGFSTGDQLFTNWQWSRRDEGQDGRTEEAVLPVDMPAAVAYQ